MDPLAPDDDSVHWCDRMRYRGPPNVVSGFFEAVGSMDVECRFVSERVNKGWWCRAFLLRVAAGHESDVTIHGNRRFNARIGEKAAGM